jgi:hypothetical protein
LSKTQNEEEPVRAMNLVVDVSASKASGNPGVFIPLHRGAHGFMSLKQFETFYWPSLKKLILG